MEKLYHELRNRPKDDAFIVSMESIKGQGAITNTNPRKSIQNLVYLYLEEELQVTPMKQST